jgi:hypothetical protein
MENEFMILLGSDFTSDSVFLWVKLCPRRNCPFFSWREAQLPSPGFRVLLRQLFHRACVAALPAGGALHHCFQTHSLAPGLVSLLHLLSGQNIIKLQTLKKVNPLV